MSPTVLLLMSPKFLGPDVLLEELLVVVVVGVYDVEVRPDLLLPVYLLLPEYESLRGS